MQLFCPNCQAAYVGTTHCTKCGGRLLSPQESFITSGPPSLPLPDPVRPTLGGRVVIGCLVAFGVLAGLREAAGVFLLPGTDPGEWWASDAAWPAVLALRLAAVVAGGLVAGAGREQGAVSGLMVGLLAGGVFTAGDAAAAGGLHGWVPIAVALMFPVVAAPAGALGTWVWPPDVPLPEPSYPVSSRGSNFSRLAVEAQIRRAGRPTAWVRVAVGGAVAAAGVIAADELRVWLARSSGGLFQTGGPARAGMVGLEIAAILMTAGAAAAGATTGAGLRHGLLAGLLAVAGVLIGAAGREDRTFPAANGLFQLLGVDPAPVTTVNAGGLVAIGILALMAVAGWLGGQLFPPLAPPAVRNRRLARQS